jgi:hypothetical protein
VVEARELLVEGGVIGAQLPGFLEEGLGGDGEELGRVLGAVAVDEGAVVPLDLALELRVLGAEHPGPGAVSGALREHRRAVGGAILLVELVGEFVEHHVVSVVRVGRAGDHVAPREHHRASRPGLPEPHHLALHQDAPLQALLAGHVGLRVDDDRAQLGVVVRLAVQQQDAGLRRDRHPDLVGDLQAKGALEHLLVQEHLDVPPQLGLLLGRQPPVIRDSPVEGRLPLRRKGPRSRLLASPGREPEHGREGTRG